MYIMESAPDARTLLNGKEMDYFCGTGYFGLQGHPQVIEAACEAVKAYGVSSATSPAVFGNTPALLAVEKNAARFLGTESALYYVSGYLGGSILLEGVRDEYDIVFVDKESHYSVLNACTISGKPVVPFEYRSPGDLEKKIKRHLRPSARPLLVCDGIFPISGDISPLPGYVQVLEQIDDAVICVDDAHAVGVIGEKGRGTFEYFGITGEKCYSSGTLSKALGGHGGIIAGDTSFIAKLKKNSKLTYAATPTANPAAAATAAALEILRANPGMRRKLWDNVAYARDRFRRLGFSLADTPVPIICLAVRGKETLDLKAVQERLFQRGIAVTYLPPGFYSSVPKGGALRISIFSTHRREQIQRLVDEIRSIL